MKTKMKTNAIAEHARKHCPYIYDDPEAGRDWCCLHGCHCIAIDSPYSHAVRGESLCKVFNTFPPMDGGNRKKTCVTCHWTFTPSSNRQRYCPQCGKTVQKENGRKRKQMSRFKAPKKIDT